MKTILIAALMLVLCGCQVSAGTGMVPSLADLVLPKKPVCVPECAKCVALPEGWTIGNCNQVQPESYVAVPERLFDQTQIRERVVPSVEPTTRIPSRLIDGATIVTDSPTPTAARVPVRVMVVPEKDPE